MSSFATQTSSKGSPTKGYSTERSESSSNEGTQSEVSLGTPDTTPQDITTTTRPALHIYSQTSGEPNPDLENAINLEHMELLLHLINSKDLFCLGGDREIYSQYLTLGRALDIGIQNPYVFHQLLGFSARHLAIVYPSKAGFYMHQAITLQTRAVSLFNACYTPITKETFVPMLLFATVLGHHVLADTLCRQNAGDLDTFIAHFVQCLGTLSGAYTIFKEARSLWPGSVLEPILSLSSSFTSRAPVGTRCQRIKEFVEASLDLNEAEKEACKAAIQYLQVGFDAAENKEPANQHQMLYLWCMLVPREFTVLLAAKNTEALVVLGHYAILLDYGRAMWQVRDAGEYFLEHLRAYLDGRVGWDWTC